MNEPGTNTALDVSVSRQGMSPWRFTVTIEGSPVIAGGFADVLVNRTLVQKMRGVVFELLRDLKFDCITVSERRESVRAEVAIGEGINCSDKTADAHNVSNDLDGGCISTSSEAAR